MKHAADWPEWPVCHLDSIVASGSRGFLVGDGDWPFRGFVLHSGDAVFAYANVCPHARHPLDMLPDVFLVPDGSMIRCGSHGALFAPESGECMVGPCVGASLLRLDVRVDDQGVVFVRAPNTMRDHGLSAWNGL